MICVLCVTCVYVSRFRRVERFIRVPCAHTSHVTETLLPSRHFSVFDHVFCFVRHFHLTLPGTRSRGVFSQTPAMFPILAPSTMRLRLKMIKLVARVVKRHHVNQMLQHIAGLGSFTFAGHSMGGGVGFQLCASFPHRLRKCILMAPIPSNGKLHVSC